MTKVSAIVSLISMGLLLSCGLHESSGVTGSACTTPGEITSCGCSGGVIGERVCQADNTYSSCDCPEIVTGQGDFNEGGSPSGFNDECHLPGNECLDGFVCIESARGTFECEFEDDAFGGAPAEGGAAGSAGEEVVVEPDLDCRETGCEGGICVAVAPGQYECQETAEPEPVPEPTNECGEFLECANACYGNRRGGTIKACFDSCNDSACYEGCIEEECETECISGVSEQAIISLNNLQSCLDRRCVEDPEPTTCLEENCSAELEDCGPIPDNFFYEGE